MALWSMFRWLYIFQMTWKLTQLHEVVLLVVQQNNAMKIFFVLAFIAATAIADQTRYDGYFFFKIHLFILICNINETHNFYNWSSYQVFKVKAKNQASFDALVSLYQESTSFDFWTEPRSIESSMDIMVPPALKQTFVHLMRAFDIDYAVKIADVQRHIIFFK